MALRSLLLAAALLGLAARARAAADAGQPGAYLLAGVGGRAAAMGDAYAALAQGPEAVYWNPAALAYGPGPALASTYNVLSLGRQSSDAELQLAWDDAPDSPVAGAFPRALNRGLGSWGLGWMGFSLGNDFEARTADTPGFTSFGDHQDAYSLAHGRALLPWLALGAAFQYYDHILDNYSAHGEGLNLGILALLGPQLKLAVTASDLWSDFRWDTGYGEQFPVAIRASLAASAWKNRITLAGQVESVQGEGVNGGFGLEAAVFRFFLLRAGLQQYGATFGGGVLVPVGKTTCAMDYAFMPDPLDQGSEQRISLQLAF